MSGRFSPNLLNASKAGTRVNFGISRLNAVVTEELTHKGRIVALNTEEFSKFWKAWVKCHYLISMKIG